MQRLKFEPSNEVLASFIRDTGYPYQRWVEETSLLDYALAAHVLEGDRQIGMVWGEWVSPTEMGAHVGLRSGALLDWPVVLPQLLAVASFLGSDHIVLSFDGSPRPKAMARLASRLGFTAEPDNRFGSSSLFRRKTHG